MSIVNTFSLRKRVYSIQMPQAVILDLDSTLLDA